MSKTTGEIEEIQKGETAKGRPYYKVIVNGTSFFAWDKKLLAGFKEGEYVTITHSDDDYPKIKSIEEAERRKRNGADEDDEDVVVKGQTNVKKYIADVERNKNIHRSVALQQAVLSVEKLKETLSIESYTTTVKSVADIYYAWLVDAEPEASDDEISE